MSAKVAGAGFVVAALTVLLWSGGIAIQTRLLDRCNTSCSSFADFERADPLCIIDPTCVSPLYKPDKAAAQSWTGLAYWRSGEHQGHPPVWKALALPNYAVFMAVMLALAVAVVHFGARVRARVLAVLAIFTWCLLSVTSWFIPSMNPDWPHVSYDTGSPSGWLALAVLVFTLGLLVGATVLTQRSLKTRARRHRRDPLVA
jgi:hypothetical protein